MLRVLYGIAGFSMEQSLQDIGDTWRPFPVHPMAEEQTRVGAEGEAPPGPEEWAETMAELWVLHLLGIS